MRRWMIWMVCLGLGLGPCVRAFAMDGNEIVTVWEEERGAAQETQQPGAQSDAQSDPLKLNAQSAVLADGLTGRVLYGKGADTIRPMASTTKIMTCILALELGSPDDVVTASREAAGQPKVHLGVRSEQTFYLKDLLYSLMLESHNDTAVMIAEHIGGSVPGFAKLMNEKARELGCENTYFITPNGLDARETDEAGVERIHSTTAADLARIMGYCVNQSPKRQEFLEITQTQNYFFTDIGGKHSYNCTNHNAFLTMMDGVVSGKTGFTGGAGYSYVAAMEKDGRPYVIAILGCGWPPHKTWKWADARKLFNFGLEHYQMRDVYQAQQFPKIPVTGGLCWDEGSGAGNDQVSLTMGPEQEAREVKLLLGEDEEVEIRQNLPARLAAPVREGQMVGSVEYRLNGQTVRQFPVYTQSGVEKITLKRCLLHIGALFGSLRQNPWTGG
ncbi:MAG: D-alanyl-D-alanine carboxypeptidase [Enterocloster asparagiformis]|nr:D-alanyl-D-alanine carboxypeptidase [Enterocloster asparagiformis]